MSAKITKRRFYSNVGLLLAVVAVVYLWFQRHVEHHLDASLLVGGTLSVWGLFEVLKTTWDWAAEDALKSLPQRVLGGERSGAYLILALFLAALLHIFTSSIWIEYEAGPDAKPAYDIAVLYAAGSQLPFIEPLHVTSADPVAGRTFFFRWKTVPLVIQIAEPHGFVPLPPQDFGWGTRIAFRVPGEFKRKEYHLLRLLPVTGVLEQLPERGSDSAAVVALELTWGGQRYVVDDLRQEAAYLGAAATEIREVVADETPEQRQAAANELLAREQMDLESRAQFLKLWEDRKGFYGTPEFKPGDKVEYRIYFRKNNRTISNGTLQIDDHHAITTHLLLAPAP